MRYLVKLVTPKGGTCLDPFAGSCTTGIACKIEGMEWVLGGLVCLVIVVWLVIVGVGQRCQMI